MKRGVERVAVLDRNLSPGRGGIFAEELKAALYGGNGTAGPKVFGYILGLGGRELLLHHSKPVLRLASDPVRAVTGLRLRALLEDRTLREETRREILDLVRGNGALDYTFRRAEEYSLRAREIMAGFPVSAHREALGALAEFVLTREH